MIGTNNVRTDTAADIGKGTGAIVNRVRAKHRATKVLLLGVLPMGVDPKDPLGRSTATEGDRNQRKTQSVR